MGQDPIKQYSAKDIRACALKPKPQLCKKLKMPYLFISKCFKWQAERIKKKLYPSKLVTRLGKSYPCTLQPLSELSWWYWWMALKTCMSSDLTLLLEWSLGDNQGYEWRFSFSYVCCCCLSSKSVSSKIVSSKILATAFNLGEPEEYIFSNNQVGNANSGGLHVVELHYYLAYLCFLIFLQWPYAPHLKMFTKASFEL